MAKNPITEAAKELLEKFFIESAEHGVKETAEELAEKAAAKLAREGFEVLTKEAVQEFMQTGLSRGTQEALETAGVRLVKADTASAVQGITTGNPIGGFSRQAPQIGADEGGIPSRVRANRPDGAGDDSAFDGVESVRTKGSDGAPETEAASSERSGGGETPENGTAVGRDDFANHKKDSPDYDSMRQNISQTAKDLSKAEKKLNKIKEPQYQDFVKPEKPWTNLTAAAVKVQKNYVSKMREFRIHKANAKLEVFEAKVDHHNALIEAGETGYIKGMDGQPLKEKILLDENSVISNFRKSGKDHTIPTTGDYELSPISVKEIYSLDANIPIEKRYSIKDKNDEIPDSIWNEQSLRESKGKERFMNETGNIATDIKNNKPIAYKIAGRLVDAVGFVSKNLLGGGIAGVGLFGLAGAAAWLGWGRIKETEVVKTATDLIEFSENSLNKLSDSVDGKKDNAPKAGDGEIDKKWLEDGATKAGDGEIDKKWLEDGTPKAGDGKVDKKWLEDASIRSKEGSVEQIMAANVDSITPTAIKEATLAAQNQTREI